MITGATASVGASQARSCVEFMEGMRGKFYAMLAAGGGALTRTREKGRSTPEERAHCVELSEQGILPEEIAERIGRSGDFVRGVLREAGVTWFLKGNRKANSGRRRDPALVAEALRLVRDEGLSNYEAAERVGKSTEWVRLVVRRAKREAGA